MLPLSSWFLSGRKALSPSTRGWWAGVFEVTLAAVLILIGVVWLVTTITLVVLDSPRSEFYMSVPYVVLQLLLASAMIFIGGYLAWVSVWKIGTSTERRKALISQATQLDLLNEIRGRRANLPTVPANAKPPSPGTTFGYRLRATRRNLWGLFGAAAVFVLFVGLAAALVIIAWYKFQMGRTDYFAGGLAIPFSIAAIWAFGYFIRQLLKLTSIGPTAVEISDYPIVPGREYRVLLRQQGRHRLKLLDVVLICQEEAKFSQGTNIRTERKTVYCNRLFRRRGLTVSVKEPFSAEFPLQIPGDAMHSFSSESNRVQWKIEICGQAKGFPRVRRSFEIIVLPAVRGPGQTSDTARSLASA